MLSQPPVMAQRPVLQTWPQRLASNKQQADNARSWLVGWVGGGADATLFWLSKGDEAAKMVAIAEVSLHVRTVDRCFDLMYSTTTR